MELHTLNIKEIKENDDGQENEENEQNEDIPENAEEEDNRNNELIEENQENKENQLNQKGEDNKKDKEITNLVEIFRRLDEEASKEKNKTLNEMYKDHINSEDISKRLIKEQCPKCCLFIMLYVVILIFGIVNMIGIYESITILKIIYQILYNSVLIYFRSLKKDPDEITKFSINDFK